jgi:cytochrome P450
MLTNLTQNSDLFSFLAQPDYLKDPYSVYKYLRENYNVFVSTMPPNFLWRQMYVLTKYSDIMNVLKDKNVGKKPPQSAEASEGYKERLSTSITSKLKDNVAVFMDPPRHTKVKAILNKAFTPKIVQDLKPHIEEIAFDLLENLKGKEKFNLKEDFARPLPVMVIAELLGIPRNHSDKIRIWAQSLVKSVDAVPMSKEEYQEMIKHGMEAAGYFQQLLMERKKSPGDDLVSELMLAKEGEERLTIDELISNCLFLLIAGHETSLNMITNGTLAFLSNPEQLEMFKGDSKLSRNAVDEVLRFDSPVQLLSRIVQTPFKINDTNIPLGEQLGLFIGSANRDPEAFENPDKFDITRKDLSHGSAHFAFGQGIHYCTGAPLGRLEGELAFKSLFETFPNLQFANGKQLDYRPSFSMRELVSLELAP